MRRYPFLSNFSNVNFIDPQIHQKIKNTKTQKKILANKRNTVTKRQGVFLIRILNLYPKLFGIKNLSKIKNGKIMFFIDNRN